eukprot:3644269-Pleurochrysis_carterae.AAC.5
MSGWSISGPIGPLGASSLGPNEYAQAIPPRKPPKWPMLSMRDPGERPITRFIKHVRPSAESVRSTPRMPRDSSTLWLRIKKKV